MTETTKLAILDALNKLPLSDGARGSVAHWAERIMEADFVASGEELLAMSDREDVPAKRQLAVIEKTFARGLEQVSTLTGAATLRLRDGPQSELQAKVANLLREISEAKESIDLNHGRPPNHRARLIAAAVIESYEALTGKAAGRTTDPLGGEGRPYPIGSLYQLCSDVFAALAVRGNVDGTLYAVLKEKN